MDKETARVLLTNFVSKIHKDLWTGVFRCDGLLSEQEVDSLVFALAAIGGQAKFPGSEDQHVQKVQPYPLNLDANARSKPDSEDVLMCLDFGTAMSKAACIRSSNETLIDIELGKAVGAADTEYGLHSSMFIGRDGIVHFGPNAISASLDEGGDRKRIDSIKQYLSQGRLGDLSRRMIEPAANPTAVPFSQADAIQLYLAYLTDIACTELARNDVGRYVIRRFARPCWEGDRAQWVDDELKKLLARAQLLADTLHGKWTSGLKLAQIKATLEQVYQLDILPTYLIDGGVPEPVASALSRIQGDELERGMFIVVDVGAGTTDLAAFWVIQDEGKGERKIWQIGHSIDAIPQAGDTIDGYLQNEILMVAHLQPGHPDYPFASTQLSLQIRQLKESLFRSGSVEAHLSNGTVVPIQLSSFLTTPAIRGFEDLLAKHLNQLLSKISPSWIERIASYRRLGKDEITLVFSGGGSALPMVQNLGSGYFERGKIKLEKKLAPSVPEWILNNYPRLANSYPQLAVAIGGGERDLPKVVDSLESIPSPGPARPGYEPATIYKR